MNFERSVARGFDHQAGVLRTNAVAALVRSLEGRSDYRRSAVGRGRFRHVPGPIAQPFLI